MPVGSGFALVNLTGGARTRGSAHSCCKTVAVGQSHHLTSGGGAVALTSGGEAGALGAGLGYRCANFNNRTTSLLDLFASTLREPVRRNAQRL